MRELIKLLIFLVLICIAAILVQAQEKPTPQNIAKQFELQAAKSMMEAIGYSNFAAKINEAIRCPCYDVKISTQRGVTLIRIDNQKCKELR